MSTHRFRWSLWLALLNCLSSTASAQKLSPFQPPQRPLGLPLMGKTYLAGSDGRSQHFDASKQSFLSIITSHLPEHVAYTGAGLNKLDPTRLYFTSAYAPRVYYIYAGTCYDNALGVTIATASEPTAKPVTGDSYTVFPFCHSSIGPFCCSGAGKRSASEPLLAGDFVELPTIKAGQQLAFFLMADMDRNANPADVYYNGKANNVDGYQHLVAFFPDDSQYLIIGFEDMYDCGGDGRERDGRERDDRERDGRDHKRERDERGRNERERDDRERRDRERKGLERDDREGGDRGCGDRDCNDLMFVIDIGPKNAAALRVPNNMVR